MSTQFKNLALVYKKHLTGVPVPAEHLAVEDVGFDSEAWAPKDGVALEHLFASFDPYMRGRMRSPEIMTSQPLSSTNRWSHGIVRAC